MQRQSDLRAYLKAKAAFHRPLEAARRRYETYGDLRRSVAFESDEEASAFRLLGCKRTEAGRLHFADLDAALRSSRFAVGLVEALELYFGQKLQTRAERRSVEDVEWDEFFARVAEHSTRADDLLSIWLVEDERYIRSEWARGDAATRKSLVAAARALMAAAENRDPVPLPAFASRVLGNPHALDHGTEARRFVDRALNLAFPELGMHAPFGAEDRAALLAAVNVVIDAISSDVTVANLAGADPIARVSADTGLPLSLPLMTIQAMRDARSTFDRVFVVENPAVFRIILNACDRLPLHGRPTLVCTAGQLTIAARKLLDSLVAGGATLHYSGDFDAKGIAIARGLAQRFGDKFVPWRMDPASYAAALMPEAEVPVFGSLRRVKDFMPDVCDAVGHTGVAYQEAIADDLAGDVIDYAVSRSAQTVIVRS